MKDLLTQLSDKFTVGDECWEWTAALDGAGYGKLNRRPYTLVAHRVIYELFNGAIPDKLVVDHLCRNRKCVRPDHLEVVTNRENCQRGHDFRKAIG